MNSIQAPTYIHMMRILFKPFRINPILIFNTNYGVFKKNFRNIFVSESPFRQHVFFCPWIKIISCDERPKRPKQMSSIHFEVHTTTKYYSKLNSKRRDNILNKVKSTLDLFTFRWNQAVPMINKKTQMELLTNSDVLNSV